MDLSSYRGKKNVVLYFYPKDGTPACTIQAIGFSDREDEFKKSIDTALEYRRRGRTERDVEDVFYNNPCRFFGQCAKWKLKPE